MRIVASFPGAWERGYAYCCAIMRICGRKPKCTQLAHAGTKLAIIFKIAKYLLCLLTLKAGQSKALGGVRLSQ